jgi:protein involved in polysaccharide export with SLBB domain
VAGTTLNVTVEAETQLSGPTVVAASGTIHMKMSDDEGGHRVEWDVPVAGTTAEEAGVAVAASLKPYLRAPIVTVTITALPSLHIDVSGAVKRSGNLALPIGSRLSDALTAAQCLPEADYAHILLLRRSAGDEAPRTLPIDLGGGSAASDMPLQYRDRLLIFARPKTVEAPVLTTARVVGEVAHEGDIPIGSTSRVKDVLAQVGGLKETADAHKIRLHRADSGRDFLLDADRIAADDPDQNLNVSPGDYLVVDRKDRALRYSVAGEVMSPQTHDFDPAAHPTLLKTIALAGGPAKSADLHRGLLRKGFLLDPTHSRDLPFDYTRVKAGKDRDWDVEAGDMVVLLARAHRPSVWQTLLPLALHFLPFGL